MSHVLEYFVFKEITIFKRDWQLLNTRTIFRIILSNKVYCWLYSQGNKNFTSLFYLLSDPMDCSLPGPSVHGILQARILEWVAIPFSGSLPYQGSNLGLWHCKQILYSLSHQWSPFYWWIVNVRTVKVFEAVFWCYTSSSYLENKVN